MATMPTSAPGNSARLTPRRRPLAWRTPAQGFTLIEVMVVMALIAVATALVSLALRDGTQARLEEEGARLSALLEAARTESRASGITVRWLPGSGTESAGDDRAASGFRFIGLPAGADLPSRWLGAGVSAEVLGAPALLLGPEPVLPRQRVVLHLEDRRLVLGSDGLAPFGPLAETANP